MRVLVTGAAGNLGSMLAKRLLNTSHQIRLLTHRRAPPADVASSGKAEVFQADLGSPSTIGSACEGVDCIVHLAGVLFAPRPEKFLPRTNIAFVQNLLRSARCAGVRKFILISFPHVEGETTPEHPATDRLDREPAVVHFRTRLAAEKAVLEMGSSGAITPVILRVGVVYGPSVKLTEAARRLLRCRILSVWRKPTWIHLISLPDFLRPWSRRLAIRASMASTTCAMTDQPRSKTSLTGSRFISDTENPGVFRNGPFTSLPSRARRALCFCTPPLP